MKVTSDPDAESLKACKVEFVLPTYSPWIVGCGEFEKFRYIVKSRKHQHWQNVAKK